MEQNEGIEDQDYQEYQGQDKQDIQEYRGMQGMIKKAHSVKVPRLYKEAAKALKQVEEQGEGLKNAIHALKHPNVKAITALVSESLRHSNLLEILLAKSKILENEKALAQQVPLTKILITELIWGKKRLGGEAKPILTVAGYQEKFDKILNKIERRSRNKETEEYRILRALVWNLPLLSKLLRNSCLNLIVLSP